MSDDLTRLTDEECSCPPPWNNDYTPSPECPVHGIKLTKAELERLSQSVETDDGTGYIYAVAYAVSSILAARTAALIERAERAERERDEEDQHHRETLDRLDDSVAELAALRAAVTGLADKWHIILPNQLRALLTDERDNRHDHGLICRPEQTLRCIDCGETYFICKVCHADVHGHHAKCRGEGDNQ